MSLQNQCVSRSRSAVIYGSFALAVCGWLGALWSWLDHGFAAGINPGFIFACTVAATFTMTLAATVVLPSKARLYALGFRHGVEEGRALGVDPERARLAVVK